MDGEKCGTLDFRLCGCRLKNRRIFAPNGAMWSFHNQISINFLVARCQKHCWSTFSHSFCPQNIFVVLKICRDFQRIFSRNKAKNAGCFRKNAGRKAKCGISRTIAGWLTPMILQWAVKTIAKCFTGMDN